MIALTSDDEVSTVAVKNALAASSKGETHLLETPMCESKADGAVEGAIRIFHGQMRTFKHRLEHRLGMHAGGTRMSAEHPLMSRLVTRTTLY